MGPGMFDDMWKGLLFLAVLIALSGVACGFGVRCACDNYRVKVERVEGARRGSAGEGA